MTKALFINGSPHKTGNTAQLLKGARTLLRRRRFAGGNCRLQPLMRLNCTSSTKNSRD